MNSVDSNQEEEDRAGSGAASCVSTPGSLSSVGTVDRLRFHHRCGTMVKLSAGQRTGERRRPLDEFNNGVVMTQRPLLPDELFEIRIDSLVDKWSGSIEVGITTHNPQALDFPSTMTNLRSGTVCSHFICGGCNIRFNNHRFPLLDYDVRLWNLNERKGNSERVRPVQSRRVGRW